MTITSHWFKIFGRRQHISKLNSTKLSYENLESDDDYRKRSEQNKRKQRYELGKLKQHLETLYIASSLK